MNRRGFIGALFATPIALKAAALLPAAASVAAPAATAAGDGLIAWWPLDDVYEIPDSGGYYISARGEGLYTSQDGGVTWERRA